MAAVMTQQLETPLRSATLGFEHLVNFERLQTRMGEIERNGDGGHAHGREPFIAKITGGAEGESPGGNLLVKLRNAPFQFTAFNAESEIANAPTQQFVVLQSHPGRF